MANIKPIEQSADKWRRRAEVAGEDYRAGVRNPRRPWAQAAAEAEQNYRAGVTAAASRGAFSAGVKRAGEERWRQMSEAKGPSRFAEGVAIGQPDWVRGFTPYHQAISSVSLPARGPRGSEQNYQRSVSVGKTLRAVKERLQGGGR